MEIDKKLGVLGTMAFTICASLSGCSLPKAETLKPLDVPDRFESLNPKGRKEQACGMYHFTDNIYQGTIKRAGMTVNVVYQDVVAHDVDNDRRRLQTQKILYFGEYSPNDHRVIGAKKLAEKGFILAFADYQEIKNGELLITNDYPAKFGCGS